MSSGKWLGILGMVLMIIQLAGCSGTQENLKQHGIEVHSGKVMRVFRF